MHKTLEKTGNFLQTLVFGIVIGAVFSNCAGVQFNYPVKDKPDCEPGVFSLAIVKDLSQPSAKVDWALYNNDPRDSIIAAISRELEATCLFNTIRIIPASLLSIDSTILHSGADYVVVPSVKEMDRTINDKSTISTTLLITSICFGLVGGLIYGMIPIPVYDTVAIDMVAYDGKTGRLILKEYYMEAFTPRIPILACNSRNGRARSAGLLSSIIFERFASELDTAIREQFIAKQPIVQQSPSIPESDSLAFGYGNAIDSMPMATAPSPVIRLPHRARPNISQGIVAITTRPETQVLVDSRHAGTGLKVSIPLTEGYHLVIGKREGAFDDLEKVTVSKDKVDTVTLGAKRLRIVWAPGFAFGSYYGEPRPSFKLNIGIKTRYSYTGIYAIVPPFVLGIDAGYLPLCTSLYSIETGAVCQWGFVFDETNEQKHGFFGVGPHIGAAFGGDHMKLNLGSAILISKQPMFFMEIGFAIEF
jgi:hypothetical protein